jgi:hypothetical protein
MDESYNAAVFAVLLGYSTLSKTQRNAFMIRLNDFTHVSPQVQRRIAEEWMRCCQRASNPAARMIAETAAVYITESKKGRKARGR